ncbi:MAG: uncharacterized protein JWO31_2243 [Phycisphaerales bacterium]|nr:uncharacterized protein [Phycisphaerales bacterium]
MSFVPAEHPGSSAERPRGDAAWVDAAVEAQADLHAGEMDPPAVLRAVVDRVRSLAGADEVVAEWTGPSGEVCRAASGAAAGQIGGAGLARATSFGLVRWAGEAVCCVDTEADDRVDRDACRRAGVRSLVAVPLRDGGRVAGALEVRSAALNAFGERDGPGLRLMAGLLSTAAGRGAESAALRASEERFRGAFDAASIGMALVAPDGRWIKVNRAVCDIVGYSEAELLATSFQAITHPDDLEADLSQVRRLLAGEVQCYHLPKRYFHKDGRVVWVLLSVSLVRDAGGGPLYFVSQIQDVTEQRRAEWLEADRRRVLERVTGSGSLDDVMGAVARLVERQADGTRASVMLLDEGQVRVAGPSLPAAFAAAVGPHAVTLAARLCGRDPAADEQGGDPNGGAGVAITVIADDPLWGEFRDAAAAGGLACCWSLPVRAADGQSLGLMAVYADRSRRPTDAEARVLRAAAGLAVVAIEQRQAVGQLAHRATHDTLTGLPNRVLFEDRLARALAQSRRDGRPVGLCLLDLDRFKQVNDTLGHEAGDALLQQFGHRVTGVIREADTLARVGGDEFALVLPGLSDPADAAAVAAKVVAAMAAPFLIGGADRPVTCSVGIALYPVDAADPPALQRAADAAMYRAKRGGRNGFAAAAGDIPAEPEPAASGRPPFYG